MPTERRKRRHVEVCLQEDVSFQTRTTGFELLELPYTALPGTHLDLIDTRVTFLGKQLAAPLLHPATVSAEAVEQELQRLLFELRVAMHGSGARDLAALRVINGP